MLARRRRRRCGQRGRRDRGRRAATATRRRARTARAAAATRRCHRCGCSGARGRRPARRRSPRSAGASPQCRTRCGADPFVAGRRPGARSRRCGPRLLGGGRGGIQPANTRTIGAPRYAATSHHAGPSRARLPALALPEVVAHREAADRELQVGAELLDVAQV